VARTLDLSANVSPDEPLFVLFDGESHKVTKWTAWQAFELQSLREGVPADAARIRELLGKALPTVKAETLDALTTEAYIVLVYYLLNGKPPERATNTAVDADPTEPEPTLT